MIAPGSAAPTTRVLQVATTTATGIPAMRRTGANRKLPLILIDPDKRDIAPAMIAINARLTVISAIGR
jgi:hypothetical protein